MKLLKYLVPDTRIFLVCVAWVICALTGYLLPGFFMGNLRSILVLAVAIGFFPFLILLNRPDIGLLLFIPASLLVPFSIGTGSESSINMPMILIGALSGVYMLDAFILKRRKLEIPDPPILVLLLFMAYSVFCFGFGQIRWYPLDPAPLRAQIGGLGIFLLSGLAYLIAAYLIEDIKTVKWIVFPFLGLGAIYIALAAFPNFGGLGGIVQNGATGSLFWIWLVALSYSQGLCNTGLPWFWRIFLFILAFAILMYCLSPAQVDWISGWLPSLLTIIIISFIAKPRWRLFILGGGFLVAAFEFQPIFNLIMGNDNAYSLSTRTAAWQIIGELIKVDPLFGLGFANYHWYVSLFPILGFMVVFNSHNNYVDIVAQAGIVGLLIFAWFIWNNWRLGWKLLEMTQDGFSRAFIYGALGGLAGTLAAGMLGDWFLPFVYNIGFNGFRASVLGWWFLGCMVAIYRIIARKQSAE